MNTPASPYFSAPFARKVMANSVLPHPAEPQSKVGRPLGRPPWVISSRPKMPVGDFAIALAEAPVVSEMLNLCSPADNGRQAQNVKVSTVAFSRSGANTHRARSDRTNFNWHRAKRF